MNMPLRKLKTAPIDGGDVIAVLKLRLRELQARRDIITKQIIGLETTTSVSRTEVSADVAQAEALLNGEQFVASRDKPMSQLTALHAERDVIDRALKIGGSRAHQLEIERATEIWAAHFDQIAEVEKRRVLLALELQRVNRDREKLRETIVRAGGAGYLSTDSADLLGLGDLGDSEVVWACQRLIADGIATLAEIERAKNG
jgi:hypothetical protein